jgi:hypothetical protein
VVRRGVDGGGVFGECGFLVSRLRPIFGSSDSTFYPLDLFLRCPHFILIAPTTASTCATFHCTPHEACVDFDETSRAEMPSAGASGSLAVRRPWLRVLTFTPFYPSSNNPAPRPFFTTHPAMFSLVLPRPSYFPSLKLTAFIHSCIIFLTLFPPLSQPFSILSTQSTHFPRVNRPVPRPFLPLISSLFSLLPSSRSLSRSN